MSLALAAASGADLPVSSDGDLLVLDPWRGVRIVTPGRFLAPADAALRAFPKVAQPWAG